jgi:rod shape determining protein RodA
LDDVDLSGLSRNGPLLLFGPAWRWASRPVVVPAEVAGSVSGFALAVALTVIAMGVAGSFVVDRAIKPYQRKRLIAFVDPAVDPLGAGYNILQSEIAVGSGRFVGKGFLSGSQSQLGFLPEKHTDFIFSLVGEETGFLGALFLLAVYFWVAWRAFDIAITARDYFGRYLATALGAFFTFSGLSISAWPWASCP